MPRTADTKRCLTWAARFGPPNEPDIGCETRELRLEKITDTDINFSSPEVLTKKVLWLHYPLVVDNLWLAC